MAIVLETGAEPLPGYTLIDRLGGGGFGEVWRCEAPGGFHKAIKFVYGNLEITTDESGQRASQELKALSRVKEVRHPYILSLERYDIIGGQLLIVMELADRSLWDRFKECRAEGMAGIPREELHRYLEEAAEALDLMNGKYQLQHLDVKPQNLFLVHNHVKVADFGLAKDFQGTHASMTGGVTPVYAAPETFDGYVTPYCDQYSLAIVYQELLTGVRPFKGVNVRNLILQHLEADPDVSSLPQADRPIIYRALAKQPDHRFPDCLTMLRQLIGNAATQSASSSGVAMGPTTDEEPTIRSPLRVADEQTSDSDDSAQLEFFPSTPSSLPSLPLSEASTSGPARFVARRTAHIRPAPAPVTEAAAAKVERIEEEGCLAPALIIGIGEMGRQVLQRARISLGERFGEPQDALPQVRFVAIDTDPEAGRRAQQESDSPWRLRPQDVHAAPLQRPSHYLRPRDSLPDLDKWLNPQMLYRIPREQQTRGARALGRLAFCDNFRSISRRLLAELDVCIHPAAIEHSKRETKLEMHTNYPHVFIVAGTSGGTGGGMLVDVAYVMRRLLQQRGLSDASTTGLLLLPFVEDEDGAATEANQLALAGTYATLAEVYHYSNPEVSFSAQYNKSHAIARDSAPPFSRCAVLTLPKEKDQRGTRKVLGLAGEYLARHVCTGVGRTLVQAHRDRQGAVRPGQFFETFGLHTVSFPRMTILKRTARMLCEKLVTRWMSKDASALGEAVKLFVQEQWRSQELTTDIFIERVQQGCEKIIEKEPESAISSALLPLIRRQAAVSAIKSRRPVEGPPLTPEDVSEVLRRLEKLVGKPDEDSGSIPGEIAKAIEKAGEKLSSYWSQKLAELPVKLIEKPQYRLAGAEEAVRQVVQIIEQVLSTHEPLSKELLQKSDEAYGRLQTLITQHEPGHSWPRRNWSLADIIELLRSFARWRYQGLVLQQVASVYVSLRGHLTDELREINYCRSRLKELLEILQKDHLKKTARTDQSHVEPAKKGRKSESDDDDTLGRHLFPSGCDDLEQAVQQVLDKIDAEDELTLDHHVQKMLRKEHRALVQVCLGPANVTRNVAISMRAVAETWLEELVQRTDVADLMLDLYPEGEELRQQLQEAYDKAKPSTVAGIPDEDAKELIVFDAPPGTSGDYLRTVVERMIPNAEVAGTVVADDVFVYREWSDVPLAKLEQLGTAGRHAYQQMCRIANYTPHNRFDVNFAVPDRNQ